MHDLKKWLVFLILVGSTLACGVELPSLPSVPGLGEATPAPTATPDGDSISYRTLTYRIALSPGEAVPGTGLVYIGPRDDGYDVTIDGLSAFKKVGDSFAWRGVVGPGVVAQYDLRLTTTVLGGDLIALGTVNLSVLNPAPLDLPFAQPSPSELEYEEILIDYYVPVGRLIPGTPLSYLGATEQGGQISGTNGYPYLRQADSFVWLGQLRENVVVRYDLRVTSYTADGLRLVGTAKLWVYP